MPAASKWLARLLLGQLGKVPAEEIVGLLAGAGLPALHLARSDRRQRDVAAVSRAIELRTLTPLEAWRVVGLVKKVAR